MGCVQVLVNPMVIANSRGGYRISERGGGGGPGNCSVLKRGVFAHTHTHTTFFPSL